MNATPPTRPKRRRRRIMIAVAILTVVALAWTLWPRRLSPIERAFVGRWSGGPRHSLELRINGKYLEWHVEPATGRRIRLIDRGRWWVTVDHVLTFDRSRGLSESWSSARRGLMPWIARPVGYGVESLNGQQLSLSTPRGTQEVWAREVHDDRNGADEAAELLAPAGRRTGATTSSPSP